MSVTIARRLFLCCGFVALAHIRIFGQTDPLQQYIDDIRNGPAMYYTDQAIDVLSQKDAMFATTARTDKEKAVKALKATAVLGDKGGKASSAIETLMQLYPIAVHCVSAHETYQSGAGTFEDWLQTKIMGEKNKFILNPPFLGYDAISQCDQYLDVSHDHALAGERYGANRTLLEAYVTINVTFRYFAGACALSRITGQTIGTDFSQWRSWWDANRSSFQPAGSAPVSSGKFVPGPVSIDVVKGGTYHFTLSTGDDFTGVVDSKDDTSMIVETREGKAYTFKNNIVKEYQLVSLPARLVLPATAMGDIAEAQIITYDALLQRGGGGGMLEVKIKSGQTFRGALSSVDGDMLRMTIEGSNIPIARSVIEQILLLPVKSARPAPVAQTQPQAPLGPLDTVIVKNTQTDDWGRPGPSFTYVGTITAETATDLTIKKLDNGVITVKRQLVEQIKKYSTGAFEEPIVKYAKPLFCPPGMMLVDVPPGKDGRPFFKVCIDKYEYPNQVEAIPQGNISFKDAKAVCEKQGKRICTAEEWQWGCSGIESYEYPYGHVYDKEACNSNSALEASGYRYKCVSKFGIGDMSGNIFEWVADRQGNPLAMGGPVSKCQNSSPGAGGDAKPQTGLRCCKGN